MFDPKPPFTLKGWHTALAILIAILLVCGVAFLGFQQALGEVRAETRAVVQRLETERKDLAETLKETVAEREALRVKVEALESRQRSESRARDKDVIIEKFDPDNGKLTERRVEAVRARSETRESTQITKRTDTDSTRETDTQKEATRREETQTERSEENTVVVTPPASQRQGKVSAGLLVTTGGVGPAVSFRLIDVGPVGLDAAAGLVNSRVHLGAQVSAEALESITLGAGLFLKADLPVEVVPGVTVQYRF